jgi:hypothetical protein
MVKICILFAHCILLHYIQSSTDYLCCRLCNYTRPTSTATKAQSPDTYYCFTQVLQTFPSYSIFADYPRQVKECVYLADATLYVSQGEGAKDKRSAVLVISGIPKTATDCSLAWGHEKTFHTLAICSTRLLKIYNTSLSGKTSLGMDDNKVQYAGVTAPISKT